MSDHDMQRTMEDFWSVREVPDEVPVTIRTAFIKPRI